MMGKEGLEAFARNLAALHRPIQFDWMSRFEVQGVPAAPRAQSRERPEPSMSAVSPGVRASRPSKPSPIAVGRRCDECSGPITHAEVYYSTVKLRQTYGGRGICRECQERDRPTQSA